MEKFRTGEYEVSNLTVIDEASSALIEASGLKLRLFGLGGAVALHKMCTFSSLMEMCADLQLTMVGRSTSDRKLTAGEGYATIAGSQGTMWTTALQMGELIDTAQRVCRDGLHRLTTDVRPD